MKSETKPLNSLDVAVLIQVARGLPLAVVKSPKIWERLSEDGRVITETIDLLLQKQAAPESTPQDILETAHYFLEMAGVSH